MSTPLPTRRLGKDGPKVTSLGFGTMGLSAYSGEILPDEERFKTLDRAYELGENFWDTSDIYDDGEDLIGKWLKRTGKRDDIFLATKFGGVITNEGHYVRSDPEHVKEACEKSLKRLGTSYIDLYYCHRLDLKTPIEQTVKAMAELKAEGMIKHLGLCEVSSASLRRAHAVHPISAVQIEYSPFTLVIEDPKINLLQTCRDLGVAVVAYSPLGRGFLTGQYQSADDFDEGDVRRFFPRFSKENFPKNLQLVDELRRIAAKKNVTSGQLALAWLLAQGEDIFPIPGTRKIKNLEENVGALDVQLTNEEVAAIRTAVDRVEVHGDRYPEGLDSSLFADTPEA